MPGVPRSPTSSAANAPPVLPSIPTSYLYSVHLPDSGYLIPPYMVPSLRTAPLVSSEGHNSRPCRLQLLQLPQVVFALGSTFPSSTFSIFLCIRTIPSSHHPAAAAAPIMTSRPIRKPSRINPARVSMQSREKSAGAWRGSPSSSRALTSRKDFHLQVQE